MSLDIDYLQEDADGNTILALALPGHSGRTVSGSAKLVRRVVLELLTEIGSIPYQTKRGSLIMDRLVNGNILSEFDVFIFFSQGLTQAASNLVGEESADDPLNEKFNGAVLNGVIIGSSSISLDITIRSQDDSGTRVVLPIQFDHLM